LVAGINWISNAKSIRDRRFAFYGPIVWNSLLCVHHSSLSLSLTEQVRTAAEYLSFWTAMNASLGVSAIQEQYKDVTTYSQVLMPHWVFVTSVSPLHVKLFRLAVSKFLCLSLLSVRQDNP